MNTRARAPFHFIAGSALAAMLLCSACQRAPERPMPPQSPPRPMAALSTDISKPSTAEPDKAAELYDASQMRSALFRYKASSVKQYRNAQGLPIRRVVIHT